MIDRDTASRLGVTPQMIDDALYDAFGQRQISMMFTQLNQYRVVLEVRPEFRNGPEAIWTTSTFTPLAAASRRSARSRASEESAVPIADQSPGAVSGRDRLVQSGARACRWATPCRRDRRASRRELGMPASIQAGFPGNGRSVSGVAERTSRCLILAALVTVYIVLGVLYESYIHPITILSTLPSAGVGALLALLICGIDLSVIALIGIILLIGIVKKNAIMMIDFALEAERNEGMTPDDAIYEACLLRFRPDHDDHDGGAAGRRAAGVGSRGRIGAAPAAGHHDHRRPACSARC